MTVNVQALYDRYRVRCEGSGCPTPHTLCTMCGTPYVTDEAEPVPEHHRFDIIRALNDGALNGLSTADSMALRFLELNHR